MKALFWIGMVAPILGLVPLIAPVPRGEPEGFKAGGVSVGVEARREEKASPLVSAAMILGGAGMMAAGKRKS